KCYYAIVEALKNLEDDETLLIQSGKPVGVFKQGGNILSLQFIRLSILLSAILPNCERAIERKSSTIATG
ncbi:unnamed protein product, partial [marine sediment metagenome]